MVNIPKQLAFLVLVASTTLAAPLPVVDEDSFDLMVRQPPNAFESSDSRSISITVAPGENHRRGLSSKREPFAPRSTQSRVVGFVHAKGNGIDCDGRYNANKQFDRPGDSSAVGLDVTSANSNDIQEPNPESSTSNGSLHRKTRHWKVMTTEGVRALREVKSSSSPIKKLIPQVGVDARLRSKGSTGGSHAGMRWGDGPSNPSTIRPEKSGLKTCKRCENARDGGEKLKLSWCSTCS